MATHFSLHQPLNLKYLGWVAALAAIGLSMSSVYWLEELRYQDQNRRMNGLEAELGSTIPQLEQVKVSEKRKNDLLWDARQEVTALEQEVQHLTSDLSIAQGEIRSLRGSVAQLESDTQILANCIADVEDFAGSTQRFTAAYQNRRFLSSSVEFISGWPPLQRLNESWSQGTCQVAQPIAEQYKAN